MGRNGFWRKLFFGAAKESIPAIKEPYIEQVMWSATLDMITCPECGKLDGKVWNIYENHPIAPLHQGCRCCLINVPYKGWQATERRDNETKEIIKYKSYRQWIKTKK